MKKLLIAFFLSTCAFAASNVQQSIYQLGNTNTWVLAYNWTADTGGNVTPTLGQLATCCQGYNVSVVEIVPGTPSPTAGYSVAIQDGAGVDVLGGAAVALSSTAAQSYPASPAATPIQGALKLVITGQSVNSARGIVYVFLSKPGQINAFNVGRNPSVATGYVLDANAILNGGAPYPALSAACTAANAVGATLVVSLRWNTLLTQGLSCPLFFLAGGILQPASGNTVTPSSTVTAPPGQQIFDISAGGTIALTKKCCTEISPVWWGAVPDFNGTTGTDSLNPFKAAVAAGLATGIPMRIPSAQFYLSGTLTLTSASRTTTWVMLGGGCAQSDVAGNLLGSWLAFGSGGLSLTAFQSNLTLDQFCVEALPSGGPNLSISTSPGFSTYSNLWLVSQNPAQSVIDLNPGGGGDVDSLKFNNINMWPAAAYSAVPFNVHASGGVIAPLSIDGQFSSLWVARTDATVPFFKMDLSGSSVPARAINIANILMESSPQGAFEFNDVTSVNLTNLTIADAPGNTVPLVKITASSGQTIGQYVFTNPEIPDGSANNTSPSVLVDIGSSNAQMQVTYVGGNVGFSRITRAGSTGQASIVAINTKLGDLVDVTPISGSQGPPSAGVPQGAQFGLNTSSIISRATLMSLPGVDLVSANCLTAGDLAVDASNRHKVTSVSWTPTPPDVGGWVYIYSTSPAGWSLGAYQIISIGGGAAILDHEVGTAGNTGGVFSVNRGAIGFQWNRFPPGNSPDLLEVCTANNDTTMSWKAVTVP